MSKKYGKLLPNACELAFALKCGVCKKIESEGAANMQSVACDVLIIIRTACFTFRYICS